MDGVSAFSYLHMRGFHFRAHRDIRIYRVHSILVAMHGRSYTRTDSVWGDTSRRNAMYRSSGHEHAFYHVSYLYYRVLSSKYGVQYPRLGSMSGGFFGGYRGSLPVPH